MFRKGNASCPYPHIMWLADGDSLMFEADCLPITIILYGDIGLLQVRQGGNKHQSIENV